MVCSEMALMHDPRLMEHKIRRCSIEDEDEDWECLIACRRVL
jgi:hypothetical protein